MRTIPAGLSQQGRVYAETLRDLHPARFAEMSEAEMMLKDEQITSDILQFVHQMMKQDPGPKDSLDQFAHRKVVMSQAREVVMNDQLEELRTEELESLEP